MDSILGHSTYSIAAVSKLTGISCHALRVWERRYGFPIPNRSPSGHRRYSADDLRGIREVIRLMHGGHHVGDAISCVLEHGAVEAVAPEPEAVETAQTTPWLRRLRDGECGEAAAMFREECRGLDPAGVVGQVIEPAMVELGEGWFRGDVPIHEERCVSDFLRRRLDQLRDEAQERNRKPRGMVIVGTVQGDRHEGGVLIVSLFLELAGWRAISLGVDLPTSAYQRAIEAWRPQALGLSFVLSRNIRKRFLELSKIRDVPVFVGGRSILNYRGLARRYGLIPIVGPGEAAVQQMTAVLERR